MRCASMTAPRSRPESISCASRTRAKSSCAALPSCHERRGGRMTRFRPIAVLLLATALAALAGAGRAQATVVFSTDFSGALPPEFSAPGATIEGVQGFAGLGPLGRQFAGNFLRYASPAVLPTTLTL